MEEEVKVEVGKLEIGIAVFTLVLSLAGSWIAVKEQLAGYMEKNSALESRVTLNTNNVLILSQDAKDLRMELLILRERSNQLAQSNKDYKESLDRLGAVLGELNSTLVRMDERFKGVESHVKDLRLRYDKFPTP